MIRVILITLINLILPFNKHRNKITRFSKKYVGLLSLLMWYNDLQIICQNKLCTHKFIKKNLMNQQVLFYSPLNFLTHCNKILILFMTLILKWCTASLLRYPKHRMRVTDQIIRISTCF